MVNIESVFLHSPDNGFWECLGDLQRQTGATDVEQNGKLQPEMMFHSQIIWQDTLGICFFKTPAVIINGHTYSTLIFQVQIPPRDILDIIPDLKVLCVEDTGDRRQNPIDVISNEIIKEANVMIKKNKRGKYHQ